MILMETENYKELRKREERGGYLKLNLTLSLAPNTLSHWLFPADLCESHYSRCVADRTQVHCPQPACVRVKIKPMSVLH